jgi:BMFP domain-containing protein YqiC
MDARSAIVGLSRAHKSEAEPVAATGTTAELDFENATRSIPEPERDVQKPTESRTPLGESTTVNVVPDAQPTMKAIPKHLARHLSGGVPLTAETPPRPAKRPPRPPGGSTTSDPEAVSVNASPSQSSFSEVLVAKQATEIATLREKNRALRAEHDAACEIAAKAKVEAQALAKRVSELESLLLDERSRCGDLEAKYSALEAESSNREAALQKKVDEADAVHKRHEETIAQQEESLAKVKRNRDILRIEYDDIAAYQKEVVAESSELLELASKLFSDAEIAMGCSM